MHLFDISRIVHMVQQMPTWNASNIVIEHCCLEPILYWRQTTAWILYACACGHHIIHISPIKQKVFKDKKNKQQALWGFQTNQPQVVVFYVRYIERQASEHYNSDVVQRLFVETEAFGVRGM